MASLFFFSAIFAMLLQFSIQVDVDGWRAQVPSNIPFVNKPQKLPDNTCQKLPCNFNNGKTCGYTLSDPGLNVNGYFKQWYQSSKLLTNTALQLANLGDGEGKLPPSGGYAVAQGLLLTRLQKYAFASPEFVSDGDRTLRFVYHSRAPGSMLQVCYYGKDGNCFFSFRMPKLEELTKNWVEAKVKLPVIQFPRRIQFVARDLGQTAWIGVDKIEVVDSKGNVCSDKN